MHIVTRGPEYYIPLRKTLVPIQTIMLIVVLYILGIDLVVQSIRWHRTPSYHNLLIIMSADAWGVIYCIVAVILTLGTVLFQRHRMVYNISHTLVLMLLTLWEAAFIIRWLTDGATTIVNVVSWGVYIYLAIRSALLWRDSVGTVMETLDGG